jgi:cytoskeletal protein RodZ
MHMSTAYFAGAGTVVIAVVVGLGGGVLIADIMNPKTSGQEIAKLERRTASAPQPASNAQSSPSGSPTSYLSATEAAATKPVVVAPAAPKAADSPQQAAAPTQLQPSPSPATTTANAAPAQTGAPAPAATEPASREANAPEAAFAKARDSDLKARDGDSKGNDADLKHSASAGRHHAEHRQQWAERRRTQRLRDPDMRRDPDLRDVEQAVREDSSPRAYVAEPVEMGPARIRLFDGD